MNSASVAGVLPEPEHLMLSPQLPVWQFPLPVLSKLQPDRPHIRPDQLSGAVKTLDWPVFRAKPPPSKYSPGKTAGQIVSLQSFVIVNTLADSDICGTDETTIKISRNDRGELRCGAICLLVCVR